MHRLWTPTRGDQHPLTGRPSGKPVAAGARGPRRLQVYFFAFGIENFFSSIDTFCVTVVMRSVDASWTSAAAD
jgi:hypothetical protein